MRMRRRFGAKKVKSIDKGLILLFFIILTSGLRYVKIVQIFVSLKEK